MIRKTSEKAILIVPIAFTTDHIETLDEIDIEFREYVEEAGKLFAVLNVLTSKILSFNCVLS